MRTSRPRIGDALAQVQRERGVGVGARRDASRTRPNGTPCEDPGGGRRPAVLGRVGRQPQDDVLAERGRAGPRRRRARTRRRSGRAARARSASPQAAARRARVPAGRRASDARAQQRARGRSAASRPSIRRRLGRPRSRRRRTARARRARRAEGRCSAATKASRIASRGSCRARGSGTRSSSPSSSASRIRLERHVIPYDSGRAPKLIGQPLGWPASQGNRLGCAVPATTEETRCRTTSTPRTERSDYQATTDPALLQSADRGEVALLDYGQLYGLWERQQWATQDLDFTQDRIDWHERIGRGRALPAHVRPVGVLHRRAARRRRARADDARRARRGHARLPLHADRRRGAPRRVLRPLLLRGRRARGRRPQGAARRRPPRTSTRSSACCSTRCSSAASTGWRASPRTSRRSSRP